MKGADRALRPHLRCIRSPCGGGRLDQVSRGAAAQRAKLIQGFQKRLHRVAIDRYPSGPTQMIRTPEPMIWIGQGKIEIAKVDVGAIRRP